jgi:murein DD-endopeptidase MepM/ murein hydrolase activator NlpD
MKLFQDYKKQSNNTRPCLVSQIIFLLLFVIFPVISFATTLEEIQAKINQKDSDIVALEKEIAAYQTELDDLGKQKSSLASSIKQLDLTRKKLNTDIAITNKKIDKTNLTINNLSLDIANKQESISTNVLSISSSIKNESEFESADLIEILLSSNNFTEIWNDIDGAMTVREKIRETTTSLKKTKTSLEDIKKVNEKAKKELVGLKSQLSDQQKIVIQNVNDKNKLLKQTKNNEANYQKLLKDRIAKRDAFEKELRDYEAELQYVLDPSKLPQGGVLSWPLSSVFVTQLFGKTVAAKRLYASGTHNGVDFRASVGTPIMAMADGTVLGIGDTDTTCYGASFGKFVFIKYNNGLSSTFGHLSLIKAYEGQVVKRGEVVGYSGNTGHTTGPHLHLSLYASDAVKMASKPSAACDGRIYRLPVAPVNAYLDALYYLPPYKINTSILNKQQ